MRPTFSELWTMDRALAASIVERLPDPKQEQQDSHKQLAEILGTLFGKKR